VAGGGAAGDGPRAGLAGSSIEALQATLQGRRDDSQQVTTSRDVIICDDFLVTLVAVVTE